MVEETAITRTVSQGTNGDYSPVSQVQHAIEVCQFYNKK